MTMRNESKVEYDVIVIGGVPLVPARHVIVPCVG